MENKIEIPLSKLKIVLLLIGAVVGLIIGVLFAMNPEEWLSSRSNSPLFVRIIGISAVAFTGIAIPFIGRKLFDDKPGLIIDEHGITDNTSATSVGLIEWEDITGVSRFEIASTKILIILTNKPDKYIERGKNGLAKRAMKSNNKIYGSPISIISNSLKIKFSELESLIISELEKRKQ